MGKAVLLAEKPAQALDLSKGIREDFVKKNGYMEGPNHIITWGIGHLVKLAEPDEQDEKWKGKWKLETLPIIPQQFKYEVVDRTSGQFKIVKEQLLRKDVDRVIIATDPDREGELIARLIIMLAKCKKPMFRFWTSDALTPAAVAKTMAKLRPASDFDALNMAALARSQSDFIIGMTATRAFTAKLGPLLSAGRVQTPVLALICKLEEAIKNFVVQDYWMIRANFLNAGSEFEGLWFDPNAKKEETPEVKDDDKDKDEKDKEENTKGGSSSSRVASKKQAEEIVARVKGKTGTIHDYTKTKKSESPPLLFSITILQQEANKIYGFTSDHTLEVAQKLYDKKLTTYPRTELQYLNDELVAEVPKIIDNLKGVIPFDAAKVFVSAKNKRVFDSKKLAAASHHALIPTAEKPIGIAGDEKKLYDLIAKRFLAAFYPNFDYQITTITIKVTEEDFFEAKGKMVVNKGWKEMYGSAGSDDLLPAMKIGDPADVIKAWHEAKKTSPPTRYTDATILADMMNAAKFVKEKDLGKILREVKGIGQPSTRAEILKTLLNRGYIERKGKFLVPTEKGMGFIAIIRDEKIADPGYTAIWEQELEDIATGAKKSSDQFMEEIKRYAHEIVQMVGNLDPNITVALSKDEQKKGAKMSNENNAVVGKCPECGADVVDRPKSFSCSNYQSTGCKFALWKDNLAKYFKCAELTAKDAKTLLKNQTIELKKLTSPTKGTVFDCKGRLQKNDKGYWGIGFEFEDKK